ncbi:MAG TPA: TIR domain-containing protein [Caulobacteraceae bacterium]|nr:TIR domain-containing protein [Caulobacteraceae bacterium]
MSHDVFISHSSLDKLAADAVCHGLEAKGIRCWIAPRDQVAGRAYGEQITAAIEHAQVMVLVFSDHVNNSQAVLNEINLAVGANVTIVPFRIAKVDFNAELNFYLGRMHWLDAFPQPVAAYIDTLAETIQRNLKRPAGEPAAPVASATPPAPASMPIGLVATHPPADPAAPHQRGAHAGLIVGGMLGGLLLVLLIVIAWPRPPNPVAAQATNTVMQAIANSIAKNADDSDDDSPDIRKPAAPAGGPQPIVGDGTEVVPVRPYNAAAVAVYEQEVVAGGPPAGLPGATVINTVQLVARLKARDAGLHSFWLIDARGCTGEPTIPTSICLNPDTIGALETQTPNKSTEIVAFCHDGACPMSYQMASQALGAGYTDVVWYRGGINAWIAAGGPTIVRGPVVQ